MSVPEPTATPTNTPISTETPTPISSATPTNTPVPSSTDYTVTQKITLRLAGQPIAVRTIVEDDAGAVTETSIRYLLTDHLGSSSQMVNHDTGNVLSGSTAQYYLFGKYRTQPTSDDTDMGFTGHRHNDEIGLIYMNARFYVGYINRFLTADTIVPDPANPQSLNRYSYVYNRPLILTDPTGHCPGSLTCFDGGESGGSWETIASFDGCSSAYLTCPTATGSYDTYANPDPLYMATANGIGVKRSASFSSGLVTVSASFGLELTWDDNELVLFSIPRISTSFGPNPDGVRQFFDSNVNYVSDSLYLAKIYNTENLAEDYCCEFSERGITAAAGSLGFNAGQAANPLEIGAEQFSRELAYSHTLGPSTGFALTVDGGESYYIPILAVGFSDGVSVSSGDQNGLNALIYFVNVIRRLDENK